MNSISSSCGGGQLHSIHSGPTLELRCVLGTEEQKCSVFALASATNLPRASLNNNNNNNNNSHRPKQHFWPTTSRKTGPAGERRPRTPTNWPLQSLALGRFLGSLLFGRVSSGQSSASLQTTYSLQYTTHSVVYCKTLGGPASVPSCTQTAQMAGPQQRAAAGN